MNCVATSETPALSCSVIICSHNPRQDYFERTLVALDKQTLSKKQWELIVIDNGSVPSIAGTGYELIASQGRIIREEVLGLTPARLRGIQEARGELLIFVDDDNILAPNYLETVQKIAASHAHLGAFGGAAKTEYEIAPMPEWRALAEAVALVRPSSKAIWSNLYENKTTPFGAGLCLRRIVGEEYTAAVRQVPLRRNLDKTGETLNLCGDTDLAWTAIDLGMGCGVFPELQFIHLVPPSRIGADYLLRAVEGFWCSWVLLHRLRELPLDTFLPYQGRLPRSLWWLSYLRQGASQRLVKMAEWNGQKRGASIPL